MIRMVSLERTAPEMTEAAQPFSSISKYDYGLTMCFNSETLAKLDLDTDNVEVGDMLHFTGMATVTSVSKHDMGNGEQCRVELQITHLGLPENESTEFVDEAE